jgi:ubiquinone/menaquinone biosynthesis C-methylase UbiE
MARPRDGLLASCTACPMCRIRHAVHCVSKAAKERFAWSFIRMVVHVSVVHDNWESGRRSSWQPWFGGGLLDHRVDVAADARDGREVQVAEGANPDDDIERAWHDPKLAQVLYHDWEAGTYDEKWSISFDERCISYARDRFRAVAGADGWPYGMALEVGAGTGFFSLNLRQAGVLDEIHVTDISTGMVEEAKRNAARLGFDIEGTVADVEEQPYDDGTFDIVVGHAVIHHIPRVEHAFREMLRVLRPGGRIVICGEPTLYGDKIARTLSRATWWTVTKALGASALTRRLLRPREELDQSSRAAALEAVVDLHTFDPAELAATVRRAGLAQVRTVTEELTAAWFGWPVRTFEAALDPERLGRRWPEFAYWSWLRLSALDRILTRVVPAELFYNVSVTGVRIA